MIRWIVLFCVGVCSLAADYAYNPKVDRKVWDALAPYFLPEDHPQKAVLDKLFGKKRILLNLERLKAAGFQNVVPQKFTRVIVMTHPELPGLIIKAYVDAQNYYKGEYEYVHWERRVTGARSIEQVLEQMQWFDTFKVPHKWIYPLPEHPAPPRAYKRKNFILVEDNMDIVTNKENKRIWASNEVTELHLERLYYLLKTIKLADCCKPHNIPWGKDGRIAFIDTESHHVSTPDYKLLGSYLSPKRKAYWLSLL